MDASVSYKTAFSSVRWQQGKHSLFQLIVQETEIAFANTSFPSDLDTKHFLYCTILQRL